MDADLRELMAIMTGAGDGAELIVVVAKRLVKMKWDEIELAASERLREWVADEPAAIRKLLDILELFCDALEELLQEEHGIKYEPGKAFQQ